MVSILAVRTGGLKSAQASRTTSGAVLVTDLGSLPGCADFFAVQNRDVLQLWV